MRVNEWLRGAGMLIERLLSLFDPSGRSPAGYDYLFRAQKSMLARHSFSDVDLLGYGECIIDPGWTTATAQA